MCFLRPVATIFSHKRNFSRNRGTVSLPIYISNASRIAAHAADIAKGLPGAADWDRKMAEARHSLDWEAQFQLAMDPEKARRYRAESQPECADSCTMCGKMCSVRNMNRIMKGEALDI